MLVLQEKMDNLQSKYKTLINILDEHMCANCKVQVTNALYVSYPNLKKRKLNTGDSSNLTFRNYLLYLIIGVVSVIAVAVSNNSIQYSTTLY